MVKTGDLKNVRRSVNMAVPSSPPSGFASILAALLEHRDLSNVQMCELMHGLLGGAYGEAEMAALLVALTMKGETAEELAAAAAVLREYGVAFVTGRNDLLDTCGTGGAGTGTFNISTATALVVAGAGVPVVKHGNRAMSSRSGSADVLAALGVAVETDRASARRCLERAGMAFCLAPQFHPSLQRIGAVRRRLGVRTMFNCLGPLANPARPAYQLLGVGRVEWLDRLAAALARLGVRRALLVCGRDGLGEVTLSAPTLVREVHQGTVREFEWTPADLGLEPCTLADLRVAGPEESAAVIRSILQGGEGPATRVVLANAAAALLVAERVTTLAEGVTRARDALASGRAARVLADLVTWSRGEAPGERLSH
jgi:anthranilate phosphoribosyltransferase